VKAKKKKNKGGGENQRRLGGGRLKTAATAWQSPA